MDTKQINKNLTPIKNRLLPPCKLREETQEPSLSDFKEIKILGKGGFGVVSLGQHIKTKKYYALKKMTKSRLTKTVLKAIQSEIEIMMPLDHENIIKLYDYFEDDSTVVLILEYAEGQQLYEKLSGTASQRFDEQSTLNYVRQLLHAIAYLHNKEPAILHRDIKPENLMLNKEKKIKLVDFGWSNYFEQDQIMRKTVCGTAAYLSPEMILGTGNDKMHDMWCIGVLIYEFLTGRDPFSPDPSQFTSQKPFEKKLYQNILHKGPQFPKNFPPLARDLCEKLLQKKAKDRLDVNQVLQHQWITQEFTESSINQLVKEQEKFDQSTQSSLKSSKSSDTNKIQSQPQQQQPQQQQQSSQLSIDQVEKIKKLKNELNELQQKQNKISQENIEKDHEITMLKAQKQELQKSLDQSQVFIIQLESQNSIEKKQFQNEIQLLKKGMQDNSELKSIQQQLDQKELELMNLKMTSTEQITKLTSRLSHCKEKKKNISEKLNQLYNEKQNNSQQQQQQQSSDELRRQSITMRQSLTQKSNNDKLCIEDSTLLRELTKILVELTIQIQNYSEKIQDISENKEKNCKEQIHNYSQLLLQENIIELKDQQNIVNNVNELIRIRSLEDKKINDQIQQVQEILKQKKIERIEIELKKELEIAKQFIKQLNKEVDILKSTNNQLKSTIKELEDAQ